VIFASHIGFQPVYSKPLIKSLPVFAGRRRARKSRSGSTSSSTSAIRQSLIRRLSNTTKPQHPEPHTRQLDERWLTFGKRSMAAGHRRARKSRSGSTSSSTSAIRQSLIRWLANKSKTLHPEPHTRQLDERWLTFGKRSMATGSRRARKSRSGLSAAKPTPCARREDRN